MEVGIVNVLVMGDVEEERWDELIGEREGEGRWEMTMDWRMEGGIGRLVFGRSRE